MSAKPEAVRQYLDQNQELLASSKVHAGKDKATLFSHGAGAEAAALDSLEASRQEEWDSESAAGGFFEGKFHWHRFNPFPHQDPEDKAVGDDYIKKIEAYLLAHYDPEKVSEDRQIPKKNIDELKQLGLFKLKIPKEYGGMGFSVVNYTRIVGLVASYCSSLAALTSAHQSIGVGQPVKIAGTPEQKKKFFTRLGTDNWLSAFALTEKNAGSDPFNMVTTANPSEDGQSYFITGEKLWITNATVAEILVVMAQTPSLWVVRNKAFGEVMIKDTVVPLPSHLAEARRQAGWREKKQITAFVVEIKDDKGEYIPGFEIVERLRFMGLDALENGFIRFTNVKVPAAHIVGDEGKGLKMAFQTLNTGRLTIPAATTYASKAMLREARKWGQQRVQMGRAVGEWQAGAEKIAQMAANTYAMDSMSQWVILLGDEADKANLDVRIEAAMAKLFCSEGNLENVQLLMRLFAGRGYQKASSKAAIGMDPVPVERWYRDAIINCIFEGTTDIMYLFLAREGTDFAVKQALAFMNPRLSLGSRAAAFVKTSVWMAQWVFRNVLPRIKFTGVKHLSGNNRRYISFINRQSQYLALRLFLAINTHFMGLQNQQLKLRRMVDIATNLFTMSATLSRTESMLAQPGQSAEQRKAVQDLCELSCRQLGRKVRGNSEHDQAQTRLMEKVRGHLSAGRLSFLEEGIVSVGELQGDFTARFSQELTKPRAANPVRL